MNTFYKIRHTKDFDINEQVLKEEWELIFNPESIRSGIIKSMGDKSFILFVAIAAFSNEKGKAFPTQKKLADVLGWSEKTVRENLKNLLELEVEGRKLITRTMEGKFKKHGVYTLHQSDSPVKEKISKRKTARDFIGLFCHLYVEKYGVVYTPNWTKDTTLVKNKLMDSFDDEIIAKIIHETFENYDTKWSNKKYPRPTIGALSTWIVNDALTLISDKEKEEKRLEEAINNADTTADTEADIWDKYLD